MIFTLDENRKAMAKLKVVGVGGAGGKLKGDRHLHFETKTITTGNLLLSILGMYGIEQDSIGDSSGHLPGLV